MNSIMTFTNLIWLNIRVSTMYKKKIKKLRVDYKKLCQLTIVRDVEGYTY